nr:ABC transporter permease [Kibdelosporangium sp. MJ126-NF4]CEL13730.1 Oligopeptide transport system permease protein OppB (TC 3.A.1.5.1) [Kibdelosporangium sp. MJ126-NF4]CTQ99417.1 Oligopeptide transport system permease protein OppB (TC 3.A.1.5.1) [Kibdelosporangium sp. MJ126-NF4]
MTDFLAPVEETIEQAPSPSRGGGAVRYLLAKVGGAIMSVLMVVVLGFFLFRVMPGDPVSIMTRGRPVSGAQLEELRRRLGFDKPLLEQFWNYLVGLLHGDFGQSYAFNAPAGQIIGERVGPTVLLSGTAAVLAAALGLWLGAKTGWHRNGPLDRGSSGVALVFWSIPPWWLGVVLLMVAGGVFPTGGMQSPDSPVAFFPHAVDVAHHMVLPVLTLVLALYGQYQLVMRASLLEEMNSDYLTTARAKGLRDDLVRRRHALPNALLPTATLVFLHLGMVVSGAITVEAVYSWPGLGQLTAEALAAKDLPLLQGIFIVLVIAVVIMNLFADLLLRVLDPRVRAS